MSILEVREFAKSKHRDQKYGDKPYISHLDSVVRVLENFGYGDNYYLVAAAYLHDVLEDTDTTFEELAKIDRFVAEIVLAVTDEPGENRKERKAKTYPKIKGNTFATIIKLADRIANVSNAINVNDKPGMFEMYKKEHAAFVKGIKGDQGFPGDLFNYLDGLMQK